PIIAVNGHIIGQELGQLAQCSSDNSDYRQNEGPGRSAVAKIGSENRGVRPLCGTGFARRQASTWETCYREGGFWEPQGFRGGFPIGLTSHESAAKVSACSV